MEIQVEQLIPGICETLSQVIGGGGGGGTTQDNIATLGQSPGETQVPLTRVSFPMTPAGTHQLHVSENGFPIQTEQLTSGKTAPTVTFSQVGFGGGGGGGGGATQVNINGDLQVPSEMRVQFPSVSVKLGGSADMLVAHHAHWSPITFPIQAPQDWFPPYVGSVMSLQTGTY